MAVGTSVAMISVWTTHSPVCVGPAGRSDGIVRPERPHLFAAAEPREPVRTENVIWPPSKIEREVRPFVEEPAGVIHRSEPSGFGYMARLLCLECCPRIGIGGRDPAKLDRDGCAFGQGNLVVFHLERLEHMEQRAF